MALAMTTASATLYGCFSAPEPPPYRATATTTAAAGNAATPGGSTKGPGGAGATAQSTWPQPGTVRAPTTGCPAPPTIDGTIGTAESGPGEWACAASLTGVYGRLYVRWAFGSLYVANDWRLRTDEPACPAMYNAFWLTTPAGRIAVRVYGDGRITALQNGTPMPQAVGAAGFGPSANLSTPHTMYEFRLDFPEMPDWLQLKEADPGNNFPRQPQPGIEADQPAESCGAEDAPMIDEPTVFALSPVAVEGQKLMAVGPSAATVRAVGSLTPAVLKRGDKAVLRAGWFDEHAGLRLFIGSREVEAATWYDDCVVFTVPAVDPGVHSVSVSDLSAAGISVTSAPLSVQVQ